MKKCERVVENIFSIRFSGARATKHLNFFFFFGNYFTLKLFPNEPKKKKLNV